MIIDELHLPLDQRTYVPAKSVGGIAGGEKYIINGIFFKIARDVRGIYGGDEFSMKSCSLERTGNLAYLSLSLPKLRVPLSTLIDYLGYRVLATSLLPLSTNSLVYGSPDGGDTVLFKSPTCNALMREAGRRLNLKGHFGGRDRTKPIYACTDIEVHTGRDDQFYIIDAARTTPPEAPTRSVSVVVMPAYEAIPPYIVDCRTKDYFESAAAVCGIAKGDFMTSEIPGEGIIAVYSRSKNTPEALVALAEKIVGLRREIKALLLAKPTYQQSRQGQMDHAAKLKDLELKLQDGDLLNRRGALMMARKEGVAGPVAFVYKLKGAHLCNLLRPEFVSSYCEHRTMTQLGLAVEALPLMKPLLLAAELYGGSLAFTTSSPFSSSSSSNPSSASDEAKGGASGGSSSAVYEAPVRKPLSPDAFTYFGFHNAKVHNKEV